MKKTNLVEFGELLSHARTVGYEWNEAHEILVNDEIPPMYEVHTRDYSVSDVDQYGWSDDTVKILTTFFEANNIEEFTLTM